MTEQEHVTKLAALLQTHPPTRDACGDYVLVGKRGNIHADGAGFSLYLQFKTAVLLNKALEGLKTLCGKPTQHGDREAVFHFELSPTFDAENRVLRKFLRPSKRRFLSEVHKQALMAASGHHRFCTKSNKETA